MAANIHLRAVDEDFKIAEKVEPINVDLSTYSVNDKNKAKGMLKLALSVTYFFVLVFFLVKLLI